VELSLTGGLRCERGRSAGSKAKWEREVEKAPPKVAEAAEEEEEEEEEEEQEEEAAGQHGNTEDWSCFACLAAGLLEMELRR